MHKEPYTTAELHQLSKTLLRDANDPSAAENIPNLTASLRTLLTPAEGEEAFGGRYHEALQRDPEAVRAHAAVKNVLGA